MSNYNDRIAEGTGHITSDSLAAESLRENASRGFASNEIDERGPAPSSNTARSTTVNTTDTSGADQLDAAPDRQSRLTDSDLKGYYRTPAQEPGLDKFADSTYSEGGGEDYGSHTIGQAPSGMDPSAPLSGGQMKPKGRNLQEVDSFDGGEENASMKYGNEIGGRNDPGRRAEQAFSARPAAGDAAYPSAGKQGSNIGQGGFENLDNNRNL